MKKTLAVLAGVTGIVVFGTTGVFADGKGPGDTMDGIVASEGLGEGMMLGSQNGEPGFPGIELTPDGYVGSMGSGPGFVESQEMTACLDWFRGKKAENSRTCSHKYPGMKGMLSKLHPVDLKKADKTRKNLSMPLQRLTSTHAGFYEVRIPKEVYSGSPLGIVLPMMIEKGPLPVDSRTFFGKFEKRDGRFVARITAVQTFSGFFPVDGWIVGPSDRKSVDPKTVSDETASQLSADFISGLKTVDMRGRKDPISKEESDIVMKKTGGSVLPVIPSGPVTVMITSWKPKDVALHVVIARSLQGTKKILSDSTSTVMETSGFSVNHTKMAAYPMGVEFEGGPGKKEAVIPGYVTTGLTADFRPKNVGKDGSFSVKYTVDIMKLRGFAKIGPQNVPALDDPVFRHGVLRLTRSNTSEGIVVDLGNGYSMNVAGHVVGAHKGPESGETFDSVSGGMGGPPVFVPSMAMMSTLPMLP